MFQKVIYTIVPLWVFNIAQISKIRVLLLHILAQNNVYFVDLVCGNVFLLFLKDESRMFNAFLEAKINYRV